MRFWVDLRLATTAGETVRRKRVSGVISQDEFDAFGQELMDCLKAHSPLYECEDDRGQIGTTGSAAASG